ncbi:MAG: RecQ family ATP-dependent DNA helicase [Ruminococcus sp.]|nr:RecQ family ATP-dependent DNA helicase [Ruminococcus sp.]
MQKIHYNPDIYAKSTEIIKTMYGSNALFRDGQYEAIEATMTHNRTLVVQKTGWGKSLVYFVCTKLMRELKRGVTIVVSPLLVLMENQISAAQKLGLRCDVLNSTVKDRRKDILTSLEQDELDLILVTPETLFSDDVQMRLKNIRIGLFVIDEAHCISDWGHDFRLKYGKLKTIIQQLPPNVPILATTATANDRVVTDLQSQLGNNVFVSRGPLTRESLYIQVLNKLNKIERYAWILENIPKLDGSGIIYCLTQRDCDYLADFLKKNGISAAAYYSRDGEAGSNINREIEENFRNNKLKVIVATIKLGMGYDKGDIAFVIHYQMPSNIVSYYQQIGRAGRNLDKAYIFLMHGKEDEEILNYFINTAFPSEQETENIIKYIGSNDGVKENEIISTLNMHNVRIKKALSFLENDGFVRKDKSYYYLTPKKFVYDREHYEMVTAIRRQEVEQMKRLAKTQECYSRYIVSCLDDKTAKNCGHCTNCLGKELLTSAISSEFIHIAEEFVNKLIIPIEPRKMWVKSNVTKPSKILHINQQGFCISKYGDAGYGELVKQGKYSKEMRFCDELVGKSVKMLRPFVQEHEISHICCVPSLSNGLVKDFAVRVAESLKLDFADILKKTPARQQKEMKNSAFQCANAYQSFFVKEDVTVPRNILLIDDVVDSRWTFTVCGYRLIEAGAENIYPFALADSSNRED